MLQKSGGTDEINGGYYDVGVNSPHLVRKLVGGMSALTSIPP